VPSAKIFYVKKATKDDFENVFSDYEVIVGKIDAYNLDLKETAEDYQSNDYEVFFTFQSDIKRTREIRGRTIEYPIFYRVDVWGYFTEKGQYFLFFGKDKPVEYVVGRFRKILKGNGVSDIIIEKLPISSELLLRVVQQDFVKINSSWWKRVGQELKAAFLSGKLKDQRNENDLYSLISQRAGEITTANFLSERLGENVLISRKKSSLAVLKKNLDNSVVIEYFKSVIYPELIRE